MSASAGFSYKVVIGLALIVALDTVVQLAWKVGADTLPETPSWEVIDIVLREPMFFVVGLLMLFQLFIWLAVLSEADLSFAQPFMSLSRITVVLASVYFLGERITPAQAVGIAMIIAGAWCISRTRRITVGGTQ
jgi:drug/metabolite transporter (DMT)-like permease